METAFASMESVGLGMAAACDSGRAARRDRRPVLENPQRNRIYQLIRAEPGIHVHAIAARLALSWGTTVYHLQVLTRRGMVVAERQGRHLHHFCNGDPATRHWLALALMRNPTARALADAILAAPGSPQKDLCAKLGITASLASWHLRRLAAAGAVEAQRSGRSVHYRPGPALLALQAPVEPLPPAAAA